MKTSLLALVTILFMGQAAVAADIRLQLNEVPTGSFPTIELKNIQVHSDGTVIQSTCKGILEIPCVEKEIARFNSEKMDAIDSLIEEARDGETVTVRSGARCLVAPSKTEHMTADNGRVFLSSGHLCTGWKANNTEAAKQLVNTLQTLRNRH